MRILFTLIISLVYIGLSYCCSTIHDSNVREIYYGRSLDNENPSFSNIQNDIGKQIFSHLKSNAYILYEGDIIHGEQNIKQFITEFSAANKGIEPYRKNFNIEVNKGLDFEIGEMQTKSALFHVMFLKSKSVASEPTIEFLVISKQHDTDIDTTSLDQWRNKWMELCNAHQASELVKQLYTADAFYYNRGRLLQGTEAITTEYGYMNSPNYSLTLTPKHIVMVTPDIAYEIGRCSGSYPLPYMLVWEKQSDGQWMVLMDSNF